MSVNKIKKNFGAILIHVRITTRIVVVPAGPRACVASAAAQRRLWTTMVQCRVTRLEEENFNRILRLGGTGEEGIALMLLLLLLMMR